MGELNPMPATVKPTKTKTIKLSVYLFTDDLADTKGEVLPKHAWSWGTVTLPSNPTHGIAGSKDVHFKSLSELPGAIERALLQQGVTLHEGKHKKKLFAA
jgi:hypothetical protein